MSSKDIPKSQPKQESFSADLDQLEWIQLQEDMELISPRPQGLKEKLIQKTKANPFVPIGCLVTAGILGYGLWCMRKGEAKKSQLMMRFRIGAQGLTVGALLIGIAIGAMKTKSNN